MKLATMGDIGGVRAVVPDQDAAYRVARRLRKNWTITRFRDYVADPKTDGYRALHLINRHRGRLIEVQIRTPLQDHWANMVETLTESAAPGLKYGQGPPHLRELFVELGSLTADVESGSPPGAAGLKVLEIMSLAASLMKEQRDES
jgi:ppGpp synthetase/RelA/SpoT-type nucleotidyltranferase